MITSRWPVDDPPASTFRPAPPSQVERLQNRYKTQGGLLKGALVQLANGKMALVMEVTGEYVQLDANDMLSGRGVITFALEVLDIQPAAPAQ